MKVACLSGPAGSLKPSCFCCAPAPGRVLANRVSVDAFSVPSAASRQSGVDMRSWET